MHWAQMSCAIALLSGCATTNSSGYCDIASPIYFDTTATIDWLAENDPQFLRSTITANETWDRLCGS